MVDVPLTLKWRIRDHRDGEIATFEGFRLKLVAQDYDGDSSWWELRDGETVLAKGESWEWSPVYHFDRCLLDAEKALDAELMRRHDIAFGRGSEHENQRNRPPGDTP